MHLLFPIQMLIRSPLRYVGIRLILLGLALNLAASARLRDSQTPVDFHKSPVRLVTDGPFQMTRNPIYLGGVAVLLGIAMFLGSLVTLLFPVFVLVVLDRIYVPIEEGEMEERFGHDYLEYKQAVRRWM